MTKTRNKFGNIKSNGKDSKLETKYQDIFRMLKIGGEIENFERLDRGDSIQLQEHFIILKNGKKSTQESIKYTPDFKLIGVDALLPVGSENIKLKADVVWVELKTDVTKTADYSIRKRLFLMQLQENELFIEISETSKKGYGLIKTCDVYQKYHPKIKNK